MSPDKPTIIFRDGWEPIGSIVLTEKEKCQAKKNLVSRYKRWGIDLNPDELSFIKI
ncbi:MAG: hypothetical protein IK021_02340 [Methanobrevibacter sp.]|nr:hypothetical protein [Methanobrevibacter sp.]